MGDFNNGFRGQRGSAGAVQTAYTDHPAIGIPGMIAFASDDRMIDSILVGETLGIAAGRGVRFVDLTQDASDYQSPPKAAYLPAGAGVEVASDFGGILVYKESIQSDEDGVPGWANGRIADILQPHRAGGRIYVKAREVIEVGDTVNWVTVAPVNESYEIGEFAPSALGGGAAGTSVALDATVARWVRGAAINDNAIIEFLGTFVAPIET